MAHLISLTDALAFLIERGMDEDEAREIIASGVSALAPPGRQIAGRLEHPREPQDGRARCLGVVDVDWRTGEAIAVYRYPLAFDEFGRVAEYCRQTVNHRVPIRVSRADVLALAPAVPPRPAPRRAGRKPGGETGDAKILAAFDELHAAGQVRYGYGGLSEAARLIYETHRGYSLAHIRKLIGSSYRERQRG